MNSNKNLPAAVIFDMDGLLVDSEPLHAECFVKTFAEYDIALTIEEYRKAITVGGMSTRDLYISLGGDLSHWKRIAEIKADHLRAILPERGRVMPGVLQLLEELKIAKVPVALATSAGARSMTIITEAFALQPLFDCIVTWQDVQTEKPNPDAFLFTANKLGVNPEQCVVLEDSPRGVLAAKRAGMKCIAVPTPFSADGDFSPATVVVNSLEEVNLEFLQKLLAP